jgi:hypothetical protein
MRSSENWDSELPYDASIELEMIVEVGPEASE